MKRLAFVLAVAAVSISQAFPQDITFSFDNAPMELSVNLFAEIDFSNVPSIGPMGEFIILPFSIKTGPQTRNYLGFGGQAGAYFTFYDGFGVVPVIAALFVGRFMISPEWVLDWDARLGFMIGSSVVFYGATGAGLHLNVPWKSRVYLGFEFTGNPAYTGGAGTPSMLYCLVIGYGIYIF